jgi:hypothetical protein
MFASPVVGGMLGQGLVTGGYLPGSSTPLVSYVLPTAATILVGGTIGDIDPTQAIILPDDAAIGDIDPTKAGVIH